MRFNKKFNNKVYILRVSDTIVKMADNTLIPTGAGAFDRAKFHALITVRDVALRSIRAALQYEGYTEVTTASLVNIAGSCEDPYASFTVSARTHGGYLSQSAQLQLEALTIQLKRKVFTVNSSFRAEDYVDPEKRKRTLSEFTLIEPEAPYENKTPEEALHELISLIERVVKKSVADILDQASYDIVVLGGDLGYLKKVVQLPFKGVTHEEALEVLQKRLNKDAAGPDLGISEEREILNHFGNVPTFVTHFPPHIKFFNMKRTADDKKTYSVDLLLPTLGEAVGGAIREDDGTKIRRYLDESRIGTFLREQHIEPAVPFGPYLRLFDRGSVPLRGGFGIGFERFVGFLIGSTDILETIAYGALQASPGGEHGGD